MHPLELIALAGFLVYVVWSLEGMFSSRQRQAGRADVWRAFASRHGLEIGDVSDRDPGKASGDGSGQEITWQFLRDRFRPPFSRASRIAGDIVVQGSVDGFTVRFDVVTVRRGATSSRRFFTRCSVDVPGLPHEVEIRSRGRVGRQLRSLVGGDDDFQRRFRVAASSARVQEYLTSFRRAALIRFSKGLDALEVDDGSFYTVTEGQVADAAVLEQQLSGALELGRNLAG